MIQEKIALPIDSNNEDYQVILVDILNNYSIEAKFKFKDNKKKFKLTECRGVYASRIGGIKYYINKIEETKPNQSNGDKKYAYYIDIDASQDANTSQSHKDQKNFCEFKIKKETDQLTYEHKIDIQVYDPFHKNNTTNKIVTDYGNGFCRFYII